MWKKAMPLPNLTEGNQCTARCKSTERQCQNLRAYGQPVCRYHGARPPQSIKRGADHPRYKHGEETNEMRAERKAAAKRIRELDQMARRLWMIHGKKLVGRKPK